jgi:acetoacetyl-CoA synthetase
MVREGELQWTPRPEWLAETNMVALMRWLEGESGLKFADYHALWRWSVDHLDDFWAAMWDYFAIDASAPYQRVLGRREMPGAEWFPGARLNYAQHVMRQERPDATALLFASETTALSSLPWSQLAGNVRVLATRLRAMGVAGPRGRVTNCPEAVVRCPWPPALAPSGQLFAGFTAVACPTFARSSRGY